ncbi:hypothetical protein Tco_0739406 [Tanacetum coccineum]
MIAVAIVLLNSFHAMVLELRHCVMDVRDCKLSDYKSYMFMMPRKVYKDAAYGRSLNMLPVLNKEIAGSYKVVTAVIGRG